MDSFAGIEFYFENNFLSDFESTALVVSTVTVE